MLQEMKATAAWDLLERRTARHDTRLEALRADVVEDLGRASDERCGIMSRLKVLEGGVKLHRKHHLVAGDLATYRDSPVVVVGYHDNNVVIAAMGRDILKRPGMYDRWLGGSAHGTRAVSPSQVTPRQVNGAS